MNKNATRKLLLHACPRCHGDLFRDLYEDEYACLQCGRRIDAVKAEAPEAVLAPAA